MSSDTTESVTFGQLENIFAKVFQVDEGDRNVLVARMKHLRTIAMPDLARPGSGQKLPYSKGMALEMLFGIGLETLGYSPRTASWVAKEVKKDLSVHQEGLKQLSLSENGGDYFIVVEHSAANRVVFEYASSKQFFGVGPGVNHLAAMRKLPAFFSALNLTVLIEKFQEAWLAQQSA